ncbi:GDSL-type esterase/lipase family protein [Butyrivibrio fibrisolvens]|uniref:GDSL-type esterase/lipase family protein n=1 Tax=Butyrivibrio fibrisolvens TaxID=831 RepID=UPI00041E9EC3|nr:GDSL-type esterase/lipase family protein [Butyrivibrio fibrisolvens]MCR4637023.1 S-layer homology domain-containing protein [Butyrivibrio sp.]
MLIASYSFGSKENMIGDTSFYDKSKGYGFVDLSSPIGNTASERSLYAGGWNLRKSYKTPWDDIVTATDNGVYINHSRDVIIFKSLVPDFGTYKITLNVNADKGDIKDMRIFAGRRNLIASEIDVPLGGSYSRSFYVNVTPYIPALTSVPCMEKAVYISITGKNAGISKLDIVQDQVPVLYVAGDSTLTDQNAPAPYYPYGSGGGWAQNIAQYFENISVCNYAHSGLTTNCFRDDGHWDILTKSIREGDIFMLQFGHNDQKRRNLTAFGGYINNLRWYVKKIREFGAYPIICSPISRIPFTDEETGKKCSLLKTYALAARQASEELNVPFIDLHTLTFNKWIELDDRANDYFMDQTHTNDYGASLIAEIVADEIRNNNIEPLCNFISPADPTPFTPDLDIKELPKEPEESSIFDINIPYVDIEGIPQYGRIATAFKGGLLDPCIMYLHPMQTMPRAQVLMVLFKALRIEGRRPYHGRYIDIGRYEWDSSFVETCVQENLIDENTTPNDMFRPDDPLTYAEFASLCERGMEKEVLKRPDLGLSECLHRAVADGIVPPEAVYIDPSSFDSSDITDGGCPITRADVYAGLCRVMEIMNTIGTKLPSDTEMHPVG